MKANESLIVLLENASEHQDGILLKISTVLENAGSVNVNK